MNAEEKGLELCWQGHRLWCHGRALLLSDRRTLAVADLHLGKASFLQEAGLALPAPAEDPDLNSLLALARQLAVTRILILGDFFHGPLRDDSPFLQSWQRSAAGRASFEWLVVAGNHDRRLRHRFPDINWLQEWREGPWVGTHEPQSNKDSAAGVINLCGHLHPGCRIGGRRSGRALPVFWLRRGQIVLPAFGSLTGTAVIRPRRDEALVIVHPQGLAPWGRALTLSDQELTEVQDDNA